MTGSACIVLASSSPRRQLLLERAGHTAVAILPRIDDSGMTIRPDRARADCASLAWFKAAQVWGQQDSWPEEAQRARVIIAADTVCVLDGKILGKPAHAKEAGAMIEGVMGKWMKVVTGVCLIDLATGSRNLFADEAALRIGDCTRERLEAHLESGSWRGRAGGFNLEEIAAAGWPVECTGDRTTVIGLPMSAVSLRLAKLADRGAA